MYLRHYQHLDRYLEPTGGDRLPESSLRWRLQAFQSLDVSLDALAEPNLARELVLNHMLSDVLPTTALAAASQGARDLHVRRCGGRWGRQRTAEAAAARRDCLAVRLCDQSCARAVGILRKRDGVTVAENDVVGRVQLDRL